MPIEFCVIHSYSSYNALLGRVTLQKFGAVPSTVHDMIKFPTRHGIATIRTESGRALCTSITPPEPLPTVDEQIRSCSIVINPKHPDKRIQIGGSLSNDIKVKLRNMLITNMDVFAWSEKDMTGVPREIAEHKLNARPILSPVRQKKRLMAPKRSEWLRMEVEKLVNANILREVHYQTWVEMRTYLGRYRFKCFLDAYKGYHQIQMVKADEDKTAFHTDQGSIVTQRCPPD
ncbi:uncharacterized protein [Rutidosis leptorrhynchoides]|uniref:uncharacterized protein n=1 Tax=Rutidosis leptorrhynchoides TaxID=125765 RepID=UPI003A99FD87